MAATEDRVFLGLYSGEAADGVDAAAVAVRGRRGRMKVRQMHHLHFPLPGPLRARIREMAAGACEQPRDVVELDREIAIAFANAAQALLRGARLTAGKVVAVGASGQPICRMPPRGPSRHGAVLQLGCPAELAARIGLPVVGGQEQSQAACDGAGAGWADWLLLRDRRLCRVSVHLGAIASLVFVGAGARPEDVVALDAGPGTILLDALAEKFFARPFDDGGALAAHGRVHSALLHELLSAKYFHLPAPKATATAEWGPVYLDRLMRLADKHRCKPEDLPATVTELSARAVAGAIARLTERPHQVVLSGGGALNIHLAGRIRALMSPCSTITSEKFGLSLRAKQAVCQAVLAAAALDAVRARDVAGGPADALVPGATLTLPTRRPAR